jgi:hypothetical protein
MGVGSKELLTWLVSVSAHHEFNPWRILFDSSSNCEITTVLKNDFPIA